MPVEMFASGPLDAGPAGGCREIVPAPVSGWPQIAMGEWELKDGAEHGDCHPHDELNYVLSGLLVVECDGVRVEAGPGDVVRVPGGRPALYSAPAHARMVYAYGPNPDGLPTTTFERAPG